MQKGSQEILSLLPFAFLEFPEETMEEFLSPDPPNKGNPGAGFGITPGGICFASQKASKPSPGVGVEPGIIPEL